MKNKHDYFAVYTPSKKLFRITKNKITRQHSYNQSYWNMKAQQISDMKQQSSRLDSKLTIQSTRRRHTGQHRPTLQVIIATVGTQQTWIIVCVCVCDKRVSVPQTEELSEILYWFIKMSLVAT